MTKRDLSSTRPRWLISLSLIHISLKIGSFEIYWYAVVICLGLVLAVLYCYRRSKLFGVKGDDFLDVVFWGFFGGIIGARAYYVAYAFDQFKDNLWQIFNFRTGGMAIYGGLIGAILVGAIACRVKKMKVLPVLDLAGMGFFIGQALGRWGNFFNQEAFGSNTTLPWGMYLSLIHISRRDGGPDDRHHPGLRQRAGLRLQKRLHLPGARPAAHRLCQPGRLRLGGRQPVSYTHLGFSTGP